MAVVGGGATDSLWPVLRASGERYAAQGFGLPVRFAAPPVVSPAAQVRLVRELLANRQLRGLCIQVIDPLALVGVLDQAVALGIPVVTMMRDVEQRLRTAYVGLDEEDVGRHLARAAAESVGGRGTIMVLRSTADDPRYADRVRGFAREIGEFEGVHILAYGDCDGRSVEARRVLREQSARFPSLGAWVSMDTWPLIGFERWEELLPEGCKLVTVGPVPAHWRVLESGACSALVGGEYGEIGHHSLRFCQLAAAGGSLIPSVYLVPARTVRAAGLGAFRSLWIEWSSPPEEKLVDTLSRGS